MAFTKTDSNNEIIRNRIQFTQPDDEEIRVEQSHKQEADINNIVKKHGLDLIAKTAAMQTFKYDENPSNDFQEVMQAVITAEKSFSSIPSEIRKEFDNNPAKFMDFIYNPDNKQKMIDMGLSPKPEPKQAPIEVQITNSETLGEQSTPPPQGEPSTPTE